MAERGRRRRPLACPGSGDLLVAVGAPADAVTRSVRAELVDRVLDRRRAEVVRPVGARRLVRPFLEKAYVAGRASGAVPENAGVVALLHVPARGELLSVARERHRARRADAAGRDV